MFIAYPFEYRGSGCPTSSATNLDPHPGQFSLACEQAVYASATARRSVTDCWLEIAGRVSVATAQGRISRKRSTSCWVLKRPMLRRSKPRARSASYPMASSTLDGSPEWWALQALPAETATPAASRAARSLPTSRSCPRNPKLKWPGKR